MDWSDDGSQIFVVADYITDAQFELFASLYATATDLTEPALVLDVVHGGTLHYDITLTR